MDRLSQLRGGASGSRDASLDGSAAGDSFLTANDTPSKYFSLSEEDSFDLSKDVTLSATPPQRSLNEDCLISNLSPIGKKDMLDYKIGKQIEAANILSGGVDIFDDNENSYDGNELVIDDNVDMDDKSPSLKSPGSSDIQFHKSDDQSGESMLMEDMGGSKETEVVLQIDGKNVDAINIGNGLYLYRKEGQEELAAVQIIDDDQQQPSFKFLKVRENAEGNLEVYEEIEIEVPKEAPAKEGKPAPQSTSHVPIKGINKVISDPGNSKIVEKKINMPEKETPIAIPKKLENETSKDATQSESVTELKMVKISESRKSPLMAYHSTPNKEGIPLTKTMVDQQLHPSRHSDNIKKTIEVHTDSCKQRILETPTKSKEVASPEKSSDKPFQVDKLINKKDPDEKVPSEAAIEMVSDVIENKSNEVIDGSKADITSNKKDHNKESHIDEVKQLVRRECVSINPESKLPVENKELQKEVEDKITISDEGNALYKSGSLETNNKNKKNETEYTITMNESDKDKDGAVKDTLSKSEVPEVKNPENLEIIEKEILPTEMIESEEMEIDENVLIIEEDAIDIQPEVPTPKENDVKELASSTEAKQKVDEDQIKHQHLEEKSSQSLSKEIKEKECESTEKTLQVQKSLSTKNETKEISLALVDNSTKNLETRLENSCKSEKNIIKIDNTQIKDTLKKLDEIEIPGSKRELIEPDNTQTNDNLKKEVMVSKREDKTEKLSDSLYQKDCTESKSSVSSSVSEMKVKDSASTSFKQEKITSKVENIRQYSQNTEKKDKSTVNDVNKTSTVLTNKEQKQMYLPKNTQNVSKPGVVKLDVKPIIVKSDLKPIVVTASAIKTVVNHKSEPAKTSLVDAKPKSINNNHAPVPFGKWTEANRQDFLNKIKESKVPVNSSNANQLKQANDLNRRDVLKKIDSQRQTYNVKVQESLQKGNVKTETAFACKTVTKHDSKAPEKSEAPLIVKPKPIVIKKPIQETVLKVQPEPPATVSSTTATKHELRRKEINNQELIDKTIEGIINRAVTGKGADDVKLVDSEVAEKTDNKAEPEVNSQPALLDAIEIKMNELHGIPFVERPPHELPKPYATEPKLSPNTEPQQETKIPNLVPLTKTQQKLKDCEDDIMKHEPVQEEVVNLTNVAPKAVAKPEASAYSVKKDKIITEKEFDKFARRNSVTYENCLTVTDTQQVIQTVVPRDAPPKKISRNEQMLAEAKAKSPHKHQAVRQYQPSKGSSKYLAAVDGQNKQYHSKLHLAYQTALTAKRRIDSPITIIEDKPVKVVYMEPSAEFTHLNAQGRDLSPAKRVPEPDTLTVGTCDSLDSDILDAIEDVKAQDETKTKSKHQRKQVLTPVETPDLELIEPGDLGIEVSPKKKRKTEPEKSLKNLVPKKSYLLGRSTPRAETVSEPLILHKEAVQPTPVAPIHNDAVSAIDNLVKAAEMLENQPEIISANTSVQNVDSPQNTPVKRGRGRPRKNPLPDGSPVVAKAPIPQKKPRLIDAKPLSSSEADSSDDDALIKENWTMGKINENIVCPICSKLFRSENVVFKHVKHCTGPSPSRSESDKRSPRRRPSRDHDKPRRDPSPARNTPPKRKSKDSGKSTSSDDVAPAETELKKTEEPIKESQKTKNKILPRSSNLVCEICGKSFRQMSYLVSHKLQHKKDEPRRASIGGQDKSIFSCEKCKKEFRKLHHLVQHRLIHNPAPSRPLRKTSSEQKETPKGSEAAKAEDPGAGFRCEPCDKSFRKLHHLVEHRETHDGINRQRSNSVTQVNPEKPTPPPQCEICKKTFRKLHHLIEHKEQHLETSSEKSDDQKSVKSSLSTKDIIHECNLCYMVFPNEHSLTKHTVICLRKKRQSAAKKAAQENKAAEDGTDGNASKAEESKVELIEEQHATETSVIEEKVEKQPETVTVPPTKVEAPEIKDDLPKNEKEETADKSESCSIETKPVPAKKVTPVPENPPPKAANKAAEVPPKIKQVDEIIVIEDTPKKKAPVKERLAPSSTKRQKAVAPAPAVEDRTAAVSSSDDDEIRYMFNPDFKTDETAESKNFMKVRAKKRSSLQIERPNPKDLVRRRSLLQHPPKIPRLRAKSDDAKAAANPLPRPGVKPNLEKIEQVPSTDSDDSDVKYSFPKTAPEKPAQTAKQEPADKEKSRRKTMAEKRKSLSGIAKRKSVGLAVVKPAPTPAKTVKRRPMAAEHRCDCGQLFSSAALLARHATLAHTPPRVRRARPAPAPPPRVRRARPAPAPPRARASHTPRTPRGAPALDSANKTTLRNRLHSGVPLPEKRTPRK